MKQMMLSFEELTVMVKKKFFYKTWLFNCVAVNRKAFKVNLMIAIVSKLTRFTLDELFWVMHINLFLKHMMPTT
jgi:hypothetical protein